MLPLPLYELHIYYGQAEGSVVKELAKQYLKQLLAMYGSTHISEITLERRLNGKPVYTQFPEIQFNTAHSTNVFVLAFVRNSRVGIDVEDLTRMIDIKPLAQFLLSEQERIKFYSSNEKSHHDQIINAWTRKEAFVKAYGRGISFPIQQLEVSLSNDLATIEATHWRESEKKEWYLHSFELLKSYRGAVAVHGKINSIEIRNAAEYCAQFRSELLTLF